MGLPIDMLRRLAHRSSISSAYYIVILLNISAANTFVTKMRAYIDEMMRSMKCFYHAR